EIKLLRADRAQATSGETGEIALRGKYIAPAFWTGSKVEQYGLDADAWFRTGDLGRCDPDGIFAHLGRRDDKLKFRGQWISGAEIEAALMEVPGVRDAAVLATERDADAKSIIAFVSWTNGELTEPELRSALQQRLPVYSLPQRVFSLSQLPLLPNGKIDRVALSPEGARRIKNKRHSPAAPGDALSLQLVRI